MVDEITSLRDCLRLPYGTLTGAYGTAGIPAPTKRGLVTGGNMLSVTGGNVLLVTCGNVLLVRGGGILLVTGSLHHLVASVSLALKAD